MSSSTACLVLSRQCKVRQGVICKAGLQRGCHSNADDVDKGSAVTTKKVQTTDQEGLHPIRMSSSKFHTYSYLRTACALNTSFSTTAESLYCIAPTKNPLAGRQSTRYLLVSTQQHNKSCKINRVAYSRLQYSAGVQTSTNRNEEGNAKCRQGEGGYPIWMTSKSFQSTGFFYALQ